jgi:hypothetical protein
MSLVSPRLPYAGIAIAPSSERGEKILMVLFPLLVQQNPSGRWSWGYRPKSQRFWEDCSLRYDHTVSVPFGATWHSLCSMQRRLDHEKKTHSCQLESILVSRIVFVASDNYSARQWLLTVQTLNIDPRNLQGSLRKLRKRDIAYPMGFYSGLNNIGKHENLVFAASSERASADDGVGFD